MTGWKTYLCAGLAMIVLGARAAGQTGIIPALTLIPDAAWDFALYVLGFGGLAALRAAVSKASAVPFEQPAQQPASSSEPELPR